MECCYVLRGLHHTRVQAIQVMEDTSFQLGIYTSVDQFNGSYYKYLITRLIGARGYNSTFVVFSEGGKILVDNGFVFTTLGFYGF